MRCGAWPPCIPTWTWCCSTSACPACAGWSCSTRLRRDYPTLPLVILSALDDPATVKAVLAGGALGFIPKSSPHQVMVHALRLVLAGGRYLPPELMPELAGDDWAASRRGQRAQEPPERSQWRPQG